MKRTEYIKYVFLSVPFGIYLCFSVGSMITRTPNCDEAWFTVPAYELIENGGFGTTILDETAGFRQVKLTGIQSYTYWIMPGYPLVRALTGYIFGWGLLETRLVSLIAGFFALLSLIYFFRALTEDIWIAVAAGCLIATDVHFIHASGFGRMDMLTLAFGAGSIATYIFARQRFLLNISSSLVIASSFSAASFFIHPIGSLWFVGLFLIVLYFDRKNLKLLHIFSVVIPFMIGFLFWTAYILQAPELFFIQFGGNASDRWAIFNSPFRAIRDEVVTRYFNAFGYSDGEIGFGTAKMWILFAYAGSLIYSIIYFYRGRRSLGILILALFLIPAMLLLILDGMKQEYYFVHLVPIFCLCVSITSLSFWRRAGAGRILSVLLISSVMVLNIATLASRFRDQGVARFQNASQVLNETLLPGETVMASGEFWFNVDRTKHVIDDYRLGAVSGRIPEYFVIDKQRYADWHSIIKDKEAETFRHIDELTGRSELVYNDGFYQIYKIVKDDAITDLPR